MHASLQTLPAESSQGGYAAAVQLLERRAPSLAAGAANFAGAVGRFGI